MIHINSTQRDPILIFIKIDHILQGISQFSTLPQIKKPFKRNCYPIGLIALTHYSWKQHRQFKFTGAGKMTPYHTKIKDENLKDEILKIIRKRQKTLEKIA